MSTAYQPESLDQIHLLQLEMAEELRTKAAFAGLTISVDEPEVLGNQIDRAVETAGGLLLLVESLSGTNTKPAIFTSLWMDVSASVLVLENPEINRCAEGHRMPALACAIAILQALHGFRPKSASVMLQGLGWEPAEDPKLLAYVAKFRCSAALPGRADLVERRPV